MIAEGFLPKHETAWRRFMQDGQVDQAVVRPEVARSWQRSRKLGLNAGATKAPVKLDPRQLATVREENNALIEAALPFMEFLKTAVKGSGFILVLTERTGVVLDVFGDVEIMAMARDNNYVAGCSRAEEEVGTNAICLALIERAPIQLTGAEHWNSRHHHWTCASAPVCAPDGSLLGSVTLSGESTHAHQHTLGMVISAAEAIQDRLREREADRHKRQGDVVLASVLGTISEAIITIDGAALVININPAAAKMLQASAGEVLGKSILKLFPDHPEIIGVLNPEKNSTAIEVSPEGARRRSHYVLTSYAMQTDGVVHGAILAVRERREYLNEVREITGFNAAFTFEDIIGDSPILQRQVELARIAARQSSRILITGPTGTGKELFAQAIHNDSPRRKGAFVALNCAAIPRELLESELFGYKGGAFTGARQSGQVGKLELADGGTLFLDEINQMPLDLQPKLLRALQEGTITRLGDTKPMRIDARVIAATNEDLYQKSSVGEFREDLYFRLSVVEISLPSLRERAGDIPQLARHILHKLGPRLDKPGLLLTQDAIDVLCRYHWPGNIRELENVLEMAAIVCEGKAIGPAHLAYRMKTLLPPGLGRAVPAPPAAPESQPMRAVEIDLIRSTMNEYSGNIAEVSRILGISRSTIYRRMKEHGITKSVRVE